MSHTTTMRTRVVAALALVSCAGGFAAAGGTASPSSDCLTVWN
jgi:hypothetical protein